MVVAAACSDAGSGAPPDAAVAGSSSTTAASLAHLDGVDRVLSGTVDLPDGFVVPPGEVWAFDPRRSTTVEVAANVEVRGTLVMHPASRDVEHVLRFVDVDETAFAGRGVDPVPTDVGLWVVGDGRLDLEGTPRAAWGYEWDPAWAGDEVVAAPTLPGDYDGFVPVAGPEDVPPPNELGYGAELLNLTRNVRVEGTAAGRAHVLIHSTRPQTIRYVAIRHVAPDLTDPSLRDRDQNETGRYGLHFHHNGEASRGSLVEGVVIRDAGNHAFVPHASHGITFRDTISFATTNAAYWWDPTTQRKPGNASDDTTYERAVAALVRTSGGRAPAFQMGEGDGNRVVGSVAVGVQGSGPNNSGFGWQGTEQGVWGFSDNLAHNNQAHGIFVWQNSAEKHVVDGFTAYHNAKAGVSHGAYRNSYTYRDLVLLDNDQRRGGDVAVEALAVGRASRDGTVEMQLWDGVATAGAVVRIGRHAQDPGAPVRFVDCDFSEVVVAEGPGHFSVTEFVGCGLQPEDVTVQFMHPESVVRAQDGASAWELTGEGAVREIAPFAGA